MTCIWFLLAHSVHFSNPALKALIQGYTREAGVRGLERQVGTVCRKVARRIVAEEITRGTITPRRSAAT